MLVKAHAKINLALDVLGTRPDGYHELETIMQTLELHDELEITAAPDITLAVQGADLPAGPENLAYRAAALLRERAGHAGGAEIRLAKRIPLAAGLAGGSADAAAVLRGLNELWHLGLGPAELAAWGAEIGSDVPFCLYGGTALVRGRGEAVTPLRDLPPLGVVLVKPPFGVSTAEVYRRYDTLANPPYPGCKRMLAAAKRGDAAGLAACLINSLEPVTMSLHPVIDTIKRELSAAGALGVLMSGSGPTVFGLFENRAAAVRAAGMIRQEDYWVAATCFQDAGRE